MGFRWRDKRQESGGRSREAGREGQKSGDGSQESGGESQAGQDRVTARKLGLALTRALATLKAATQAVGEGEDPLVSIGPSGIGGPYQKEIMARRVCATPRGEPAE